MDSTAFFSLLAVAMAMVLLLDLISRWIRLTYLSEPILALGIGIVAGPAMGFGFLDLGKIGEPKAIVEYMAQITLAIGLMGVALSFFILPIFLLIGLIVPWLEWVAMAWPGLLFAICVLLFRRLPAWIALASLTPGLRRREMIFAGWFGPIGIAALYYALHAEKESGNPLVWPLTTLTICLSVVVHGATITPFSRL